MMPCFQSWEGEEEAGLSCKKKEKDGTTISDAKSQHRFKAPPDLLWSSLPSFGKSTQPNNQPESQGSSRRATLNKSLT